MISRLTAVAASLTFAAELLHDVRVTHAATTQAPVVHLGRAVITARPVPAVPR